MGLVFISFYHLSPLPFYSKPYKSNAPIDSLVYELSYYSFLKQAWLISESTSASSAFPLCLAPLHIFIRNYVLFEYFFIGLFFEVNLPQ